MPSVVNPILRNEVQENPYNPCANHSPQGESHRTFSPKNMSTHQQISLLPHFSNFIIASKTGRRLMPSGKKITSGTIQQYQCVFQLLNQYEQTTKEKLRICLLLRTSLREIKKEKNYWSRFYKKFLLFLHKEKNCYDQYIAAVFKIIKTFFNYLLKEKCLPVGDFHKQFRIPAQENMPVIVTPAQLNFLITNKEFEQSLTQSLQRTKDIFVFGCTVALRRQDLMRLKKDNIQFTPQGAELCLHTQKTGSVVKLPLPQYAIDIYHKYKRKAGVYVLPKLSGTNLNKQIKLLIQKAGWDYCLPKIRYKQGRAVEIKNHQNQSLRFYEHITAHTMRRTAITTLLLMGVDETSVRRISGHAP